MKASSHKFDRALLRGARQAKENRRDVLTWRKIKRIERAKGPIRISVTGAPPPVEEAST